MTGKQLLAVGALAILMSGCEGGATSPASPTPASPSTVTFTLSGTISEMTSTGTAPVEGARVAAEVPGPVSMTDANGRYTLPGLAAMPRSIAVSKSGYVTVNRAVMMSDGTQLDIQLVKIAMNVLSGVVFERTAEGIVPIEGVEVYCDSCGSPDGHTWVYTNANGFYSLGWAMNGSHPLFVAKAGFQIRDPTDPLRGKEGSIVATVNGDTRFDIELIRQ